MTATKKKPNRKAEAKPSRNGTHAGNGKAAFAAEHKGAPLLGEVITWQSGGGTSHAAVLAALKGQGLDLDVASEFLPRSAFTRAAKKLADERVIDQVNEDGTGIKFQFTKRHLKDAASGGKEWEYKPECFLELDKQLGKVSCPADPDLAAHAQELLDQAMEARTSSDVTKIVQKLFDRQADLFPVRDQGGVYFVPDRFSGFTDRVEAFLSGIGGRVSRFPVPAGTPRGDRAVTDAVADGLKSLVEEHNRTVDGFGADNRFGTVQAQGERIKRTRAKVEAYAEYLKDRAGELSLAVDEADERLRQKIKALSEERAAAPVTHTAAGGTRAFVFGFSVTAAVRKLRLEGWGFKEIRRVVDRVVGAGQVADATIRTHMGAAASGERGEPAPLTDAQLAELTALRDGAVNDKGEGENGGR